MDIKYITSTVSVEDSDGSISMYNVKSHANNCYFDSTENLSLGTQLASLGTASLKPASTTTEAITTQPTDTNTTLNSYELYATYLAIKEKIEECLPVSTMSSYLGKSFLSSFLPISGGSALRLCTHGNLQTGAASNDSDLAKVGHFHTEYVSKESVNILLTKCFYD